MAGVELELRTLISRQKAGNSLAVVADLCVARWMFEARI